MSRTDTSRADGLGDRRLTIGFAALLVLAYLWMYLAHNGRPHGDPAELSGWWNWFDQIRYRRAAEALATLRFDPDAHHYPFGYPLLGAPFVPITPNHPFFVANLASFVAGGLLLFHIAKRWIGPREAAAVVLVVGFLARGELVTSLVPPWSTIPTFALSYAMIFVALSRPPSTKRVVVLAALAGGVLLCRPFDAFLLSPILVVAVLELPGLRTQARAAASGIAVLLAAYGVHVGMNVLTFGAATSPYERFMAAHIGFFDHSFFLKAYVTYLDGNPVYRFHEPVLLERLPWLLGCLPGLIWVCARERLRVAGSVAAAFASVVAYTAYNNMSPDSFYRYSLVHYTAWVLPLAGVCAWLTVRRAWRELPRRVTIAALAVPIAIVWFVRIEETDALVARVDDRGRVRPQSDALPGGYDVLVVRGVPFDGIGPLRRGDHTLANPRDFHMRRALHRLTPLDGYAIAFADPIEPRELSLRGPGIRGQEVELRRLRVRWTAVPPMVRKLFEGRRWGVDRLVAGLTSPAARFATEVGEVDAKAGTIRTTGTAGVLQSGPGVPLERGSYDALWIGTVAVAGTVELAALDVDQGLVIAEASAEIEARRRPGRIARLRFRVVADGTPLDVRLTVPADVDLSLHTIEIVPAG